MGAQQPRVRHDKKDESVKKKKKATRKQDLIHVFLLSLVFSSVSDIPIPLPKWEISSHQVL